MGKICAVGNCESGTHKNVARRKAAGRRPISLFAIPQRNNALVTWSNALQQKLRRTDFVCELHFSEGSVIKDDRTVLRDGTVSVIPRLKSILVENAIPIPIAEKEVLVPATQRDSPRLEERPDNESGCGVLSEGISRPPLDFGEQSILFATVPWTPANLVEEPRSRGGKDPQPCARNGQVSNTQRDEESRQDDEPDCHSSTALVQESTTARPHTAAQKENIYPVTEARNCVTEAEPILEATECMSQDDESSLKNEDWTDIDVPLPFTIDEVFDHLKAITLLPERWCWMTNRRNDQSIVFVQLDAYTQVPRLRLVLYNDLSATVSTVDGKIDIELESIVTSMESLEQLLVDINKRVVCSGTGMDEQSRAQTCRGFVPCNEYTNHVITPRCGFCRKLRQNIRKRNKKRKTSLKSRYARLKHRSTVKHRALKRLRQKGKRLQKLIVEAHEKCTAIEERALQNAISELPSLQQEAVRACFKNSKVTHRNQRRYTLDWVYECLLMRIKNSKLYDHLRSRNILPLPCKDTLNRYIQKLDTSYGFQQAVFECLLLKASRMEHVDKRGTLLIDEMSLSEAITLDRKTLKFNGFVDLGEHTPENLLNTRADHALVFMFQPFRGVWIQALGCFLSKNSVTSQVLHKLILECLLKLSGSGFHVDVITMDGAQWNRGVWKLFGIQDGQFSCQHPCDDNRRLWMMSDFPHLIKCFRNGIMAPKVASFTTPDGTVKKKHWEALLNHEGPTKPNMRVAYKLTETHLNPKGYQTMNVPLAFELFSDRVRVAMELYKDNPKCPMLKDATPTIKFIKVVDDLIQAMMSRKPLEALRPYDGCPRKKAIEEFLKYLNTWESVVKDEGAKLPISSSTVTGLKVTLGGTLELLEFLHKEHNFDYLMTARLNQDALERFFGMMRNACGSNDHPEPVLFSQVFRLLCTYSLVKPPKGSNVSGTELLETLMQTKESLAARQHPKDELFAKLDAAIDAGQFLAPADPSPAALVDRDHGYLETESMSSHSHLSTHDYDVVKTSDEVLAYVAGYVARKITRVTRCEDCIKRLVSEDACERDKLIVLMSRYGGLIYPSEELFKLLNTLEAVVLDIVGKLTVKENTLHQIVERVAELENWTLVGCSEHEKEVTKRTTTFYLVTRAHFLAKTVNENYNARKVRTKMLRKNAKL